MMALFKFCPTIAGANQKLASQPAKSFDSWDLTSPYVNYTEIYLVLIGWFNMTSSDKSLNVTELYLYVKVLQPQYVQQATQKSMRLPKVVVVLNNSIDRGQPFEQIRSSHIATSPFSERGHAPNVNLSTLSLFWLTFGGTAEKSTFNSLITQS